MWSPEDAARMAQLIEGISSWINVNQNVFDTDGLMEGVINPEDEFLEDSREQSGEVVSIEGIESKKFKMNVSGWLT